MRSDTLEQGFLGVYREFAVQLSSIEFMVVVVETSRDLTILRLAHCRKQERFSLKVIFAVGDFW